MYVTDISGDKVVKSYVIVSTVNNLFESDWKEDKFQIYTIDWASKSNNMDR